MLKLARTLLVAWLSLFAVHAAAMAATPRIPPWEVGKSRGEDLAVAIYLFGPGQNLEEWWGHIALHIADTRTKEELLYNWGMFAFDSELVKGFATGHLRFWVDSEPVRPTVGFYRRFGRSVKAYDLDLTPAERLELAALVTRNVEPENRFYDYEYFKDNCATRIRDILDKVLQGRIAEATKNAPSRMTLRDHVDVLTSRNRPMGLLLGFLLNTSIDGPATVWQEMFLPHELVRALLPLEIPLPEGGTRRLVHEERVLFEGNPNLGPVPVRAAFPWDLLAGMTLGALPLGLLGWKRVRCPVARRSGLALSAFLAGIVLGIPGTVLFIFNVASGHTYTYWNANLLLGNPLTLALVVLGPAILWRGTRKAEVAKLVSLALAVLAFAALALEPVPAWGFQRNGEYLRLAVPWLTGLAAAFAWNHKLPREEKHA